MSDILYTVVSNCRMVDQDPGDTTTWIRADIILAGAAVASGFAPERPPYVEGTARTSAISLAQINFIKGVLVEDIRQDPRFVEKTVKGPS